MIQTYSKKVMQHFLKPKNVGKIKNPDAVGKVENDACGDIMKIYIKIKKTKKDEIIQDIKFETLGCPAAIAASDVLCELVKGKNLKQAKKVSKILHGKKSNLKEKKK